MIACFFSIQSFECKFSHLLIEIVVVLLFELNCLFLPHYIVDPSTVLWINKLMTVSDCINFVNNLVLNEINGMSSQAARWWLLHYVVDHLKQPKFLLFQKIQNFPCFGRQRYRVDPFTKTHFFWSLNRSVLK